LGGEKAYKPIGVRFSLKWGGGVGGGKIAYILYAPQFSLKEKAQRAKDYILSALR
jgi:hypothetical protein